VLKFLVAAIALMPVAVLAQTTASVPVATTVQQQFDAGAAAITAGDWQKALEIYSALDTRLTKGAAVSRNLEIVRLREGTALFQLSRYDEAEPLLEHAIESLPANDASLQSDRYQAIDLLSGAAELRYDYPRSIRWLKLLRESASSDRERLNALTRLVRIGIFVDPEVALSDADTSVAMVAANPKIDAETSGYVHDLRGRTLLNLGRVQEARIELNTAIKLLGGLSYGKVSIADTVARSDAAIAALLDKDPTKARELLAFAGAAMQADQGFQLGKNMTPPQCGGVNGPKPEDVAVVELAIRDNGGVAYARPVYFSGRPDIAAQFAQAVSEWSWSPDELKEVLPFFRQQTRIEMRCTTVSNGPNISDMLNPSREAWFKSVGVIPFALRDAGLTDQLSALKKELALREAASGAMSVQLLPVLGLLAYNPLLPQKEEVALRSRAEQIAFANSAPASVKLMFGSTDYIKSTSRGFVANRDKYQKHLRGLLAQADVANDAVARVAVGLTLYDSLSLTDRKHEGEPLLQAIIDDKDRASNDPFRVGALIRLANLEFTDGKVQSARALYEETGLSGQQCALVDAKPRQTGGTISDSDYPTEALMSGFSGWTVVEFDIAADGKTLNQRPLISFPPFVFGDPTVARIKSFKYEQSYRPAGGLGCGGQRQQVTYRAHP
jgi:tetratricopeptide (TPR) repeat protein